MALLNRLDGPDDGGSELHAWLCDACIRGDHAGCAMPECECDADEHQEPEPTCEACGTTKGAEQCPTCGRWLCLDEAWYFHDENKECGSAYPEPHEYLG